MPSLEDLRKRLRSPKTEFCHHEFTPWRPYTDILNIRSCKVCGAEQFDKGKSACSEHKWEINHAGNYKHCTICHERVSIPACYHDWSMWRPFAVVKTELETMETLTRECTRCRETSFKEVVRRNGEEYCVRCGGVCPPDQFTCASCWDREYKRSR